MSISAKDLELILQKQEERYEKLLSTLLSKRDVSPPAAATKERTAEQIMESLSHSIAEFIYDPPEIKQCFRSKDRFVSPEEVYHGEHQWTPYDISD